MRQITDEMLLADLKRVAKEHSVTTKVGYERYGRYPLTLILGRFQSWQQVRSRAGLWHDGNKVALREEREQKAERLARRKPRMCLKCEESFLSYGPHNRICEGCDKANEHIRHGIAECGIVHPRRWRQAV